MGETEKKSDKANRGKSKMPPPKTIEDDDVEDGDIATLKAQGFSDDDVWDIAAIAAFYAMSNRLANVMSIRPNDEFYGMGR